jgi:hypothetical protein
VWSLIEALAFSLSYLPSCIAERDTAADQLGIGEHYRQIVASTIADQGKFPNAGTLILNLHLNEAWWRILR